ncbi:DNA gyrase/topoisomerase IV subunit A [bacterium]|nr:DNA gyrase/topoisomerase IV subunit A [bacterium]
MSDELDNEEEFDDLEGEETGDEGFDNDDFDGEEEGAQNERIIDTPLSDMYKTWFLDYASYVILERAVPAGNDGLKPVQRRILHSMREMEDGRFHKVANIIGQTMQYHPHGDAAIGDALVNLGQKDLLIDTQGNWGDVLTGDSAAAPRYIEARLTKFALEVAFNPKTTAWQRSYDGRKNEPVFLPMKFPLLLAQGAEGIAVGLSTKILPHNFRELCKASIDILKDKKVNLLPDFQTGGMMDASNYNEGKRGGKVRVRAKIEQFDKTTLLIKEIPFGTTTSSLIDSIIKANDNGKIKIKKVVDNTSKDVEIEISLAKGVSPDVTIDALYKFTDCEVSISPNCCVIIDDKPRFMGVNELLNHCTFLTRDLLKLELEIKLRELEDKWHMSSLEKIFIENRIYRDIEEEETWEGVIHAIDKGLQPFKKLLMRKVTEEDIVKLTEIRIKRISKFDSFKADEYIKGLEGEMEDTLYDISHINDFTIAYYQNLLDKYGKGKERKTILKEFDNIDATLVAVANEKLYVDRKEGFVGYGLKKDEYICDCSDIDDIIVILKSGKYMVTKVSEKAFVGKEILYANVWKRNDDRMVYNVVYVDGKTGIARAKRFSITSITRDREYDITRGERGSKILYLSANPNAESEIIQVALTPGSKARKKVFDFNFGEIDIRGRSSQGNILTKQPIKKIFFKEKGASTIGGRDIWYDSILGKINTEERGEYLGNFQTDDRILVIYKNGEYELTQFDVAKIFQSEQVYLLEKYNPNAVISTIYYDGDLKTYYYKRFQIETLTLDKRFGFIGESGTANMVYATTKKGTVIEIKEGRLRKEAVTRSVVLDEMIDVKGWKSRGNKFSERVFDAKTKTDGEEFDPPKPSASVQPDGQTGLFSEE